MMAATRRLDTPSTTRVDAGVAATVEQIEEDDVVVVNEDGRTWLVTDTVELSLADDETNRERKRAVRMQSRRRGDARAATVALVLVTYPGRREAAVHVLDAGARIEQHGVYEVDHVEILDPEPSWVVTRRSGHTEVFHLPAPVAAASGDAFPACGGSPSSESQPEYRFVSRKAVPNIQVCRDCARRRRPRVLNTIACPACDRNIASGLLQGPRAGGAAGLEYECPESDCSFAGTIDLAPASTDRVGVLGGGGV